MKCVPPEKEWNNAKKLVEEVSNYQARIVALEAEIEGYSQQNTQLKHWHSPVIIGFYVGREDKSKRWFSLTTKHNLTHTGGGVSLFFHGKIIVFVAPPGYLEHSEFLWPEFSTGYSQVHTPTNRSVILNWIFLGAHSDQSECAKIYEYFCVCGFCFLCEIHFPPGTIPGH